MANIAIVGMGMMGRTHYEAYGNIADAKVVAIADLEERRAAGDLAGTAGNVLRGGITHLPMDNIRGVRDYRELLAMNDVDVIDVCVPTPAHAEIAIAALAAGKHVVCEKPLARTLAEAEAIAAAAASAKTFFMPAMVMRFWPQWVWLKQAADERRYGKIVAAHFRRLASLPRGWYRDGAMSGGAALDLHIHDVDFIYYLFGRPRSLFSRGYSKTSGAVDHLLTHFIYDDVPLVTAEGGWCHADGFSFQMRYLVNFENATAEFDLSRPQPLTLTAAGKTEPVDCGPGAGYEPELRYFIECVAGGTKPAVVTAEDGVENLRIVEAENQSIRTGTAVSF
jgi:predicted dehydrogenase